MRFVLSLVLLSLGSVAAFGQPRALMVGGQQAPGTPAGVTFGITGGGQHMGVPIINNGTVSVFSALTGPGVTSSNMFGYWAVLPDFSVNYVARNGDVAPGTSGAIFSSVAGNEFPTSPLHIAPNGTLAFRGTLATGGDVTTANNKGIWYGTPGNMQLLARTGDAAPGIAGGVYSMLGFSYMVADGRVIHNADLVLGGPITTQNNTAFWVSTPGNETLWLREGDVAPGTGGATWNLLNYGGVNSAGKGVFANNLTGGGSGIWSGTPGTMQLVARTGDPAPGVPGATFNGLNTPVILDDGRSIVNGSMPTGSGGVTSANSSGIWIGNDSTDLQLLYRQGFQVPGMAAGVNFGSPGTPMARGNSFLFTSLITGTGVTASNNAAIFVWSATTGLTLVAREGDVAPGTGGALLGNIGAISPLNHGALPALGEDGSAVFYIPLTGIGVTANNNAGIFMYDHGTLFLIARRGQVIDLDPGPGQDLATIAQMSIIQHYFNNLRVDSPIDGGNQIAWLASFTDGRNAIMLSSVPEPSTYALIAVTGAVGGFTWRCLRRHSRFRRRSS